MITPEEKQILLNVEKSLEKIKSFFNLSDKNYQMTNIYIQDRDITRTTLTLEMVLLTFKIECEFYDADLNEFVLTIKEVDDIIGKFFQKISFDSQGKIKKPNEDTLTCGGLIVNSIHSTESRDYKVILELDAMFSN